MPPPEIMSSPETMPSPEISPTAAKEAANLRARWETLTYRQQEVALLVLRENLTNNQIAHRLSLSPQTIKSHLTIVYARLSVRNRLQFRVQMRSIELLDEYLENHPTPIREEKTPPPAA